MSEQVQCAVAFGFSVEGRRSDGTDTKKNCETDLLRLISQTTKILNIGSDTAFDDSSSNK